MTNVHPEAADRRWAARHEAIVRDLVLEYALTADGNRAFGGPLEQLAAWREARSNVLGEREGTVAERGAAGGLSRSALLRELVSGMQAAAQSHPEVARVLGPAAPPGDYRDPRVVSRTPWTAANWALRDERQWQGSAVAVPAQSATDRGRPAAPRRAGGLGPHRQPLSAVAGAREPAGSRPPALMPDEAPPAAAAADQVADVPPAQLQPVPAPPAGPPALDALPLSHYPSERRPLLVHLRRLQPSGRRSQRSGLKTIARAISHGRLEPEEVPWHLLRYQYTSAIRDWLAASQRPGTANTYLSGLRGVLKECWRLDWMSTDDYLRAVELDPVPGFSVPRGRHLGGGEVRALFEHLAQDPRPIARRDAAALALLVGAGVRGRELAGLERQDLDTEMGRILVRGKGRKERVAWLAPSALPAVRDWLQVRGDQPGPLFNPVLKGGRIQEPAMSAQAVYRRTWIRELLEVTDLSNARQLAGHARADTTAGYDRRPEASRRRAAAMLHVPYVPPRAA